jgi:hypothetical protein
MENTYNDKPKFDPNKPFQEVKEPKPKFDPTQKFEVVAEAPKKKVGGLGSALGAAVGKQLASAPPSTSKDRYEQEVSSTKNNLEEFNKRLKGETIFRQTPAGWKWDTVDFADIDQDKRNTIADDKWEVGDIVKDNNPKVSPTGFRQLQKINGKYIWSHVEKPFLDEQKLPEFSVRASKSKTDAKIISCVQLRKQTTVIRLPTIYTRTVMLLKH